MRSESQPDVGVCCGFIQLLSNSWSMANEFKHYISQNVVEGANMWSLVLGGVMV